VRTTIDIPDPLYRELKVRAAQQGSTVKAIILRGVEKEMRGETEARTRVKLPLIRGKGTRKINPTNAEIDQILFG
jgi:plasmid stability protein